MRGNAGLKGENNSQFNSAIAIALLVLLSSYASLFSAFQEQQKSEPLQEFTTEPAFSSSSSFEHWSGPDNFHPNANQSGVNQTINSSIQLPYNQTISSAQISVQPIFTAKNDNGTLFGPDSSNKWNGTHNNSNGIGHSGMLTLATNSSLGRLTSFENNVLTPVNWLGRGNDDDIWHILRPTIDSLNTSSGQQVPSSSAQGLGYLSSRALGDLSENTSSCLQSFSYDVPSYVNNYSLTTKVWLSLLDSDAVWVEAMNDSGIWQVINPDSNYTNSSSLNGAPTMVWSGQTNAWIPIRFQLDSIIPPQSSEIKIRFCLKTSSLNSARAGVFFDDMNIHNDGDQSGAWFHGSLSGDYLPNANGRLIVAADISNLSGPLEIELFTNWDIEGGFSDGMTTWLSLDNGTNWFLLSLSPGHPGNGLWYKGNYYQSESGRWIPISYSLPANASIHANASNALFRFLVQTDSQVNYGGLSTSGWEGMAIDEIAIYANRSSNNSQKRMIANFTNPSDGQYGNLSGWLNYSGTSPNQWNWTNLMGANGPSNIYERFDSGNIAPAGWSIQTKDTRQFEIGAVSNSAGFGPASWPTGNNGAGIYLTNKYTSDMYTHLVTPIYDIPENSTARLTFKSWVCTESSWDGGAVSLSTDGGDNWWFIAPDLNGFHDQLSQVNTQSPFYGEGIFDGSSIVGGCHNVVRGFDLKQSDLSNLSGQSVRARFSFFSDAYVQLDGWYLDDAGIEIDAFVPQGEWTSDLISFDGDFQNGGLLDGFVEESEATEIRFDILAANGDKIAHLQNKTLPLLVDLDQTIHSQFRVRVRMSSDIQLQTPVLKSLSFGSNTYLDSYHLQSQPQNYSITGQSNLNYSSPDVISASGLTTISWDINPVCPMKNGRLTIVGDNVSISHPGLTVNLQQWKQSPARTIYDVASSVTFRNSSILGLTMFAGDEISSIMFEPDCIFAPSGVKITLASTLDIFEMEQNQSLYHTTQQMVNASDVDALIDLYHLGGLREIVNISLTVQTSRGAVKVDFGWNDEAIMGDNITSVNSTRWIPGQSINLQTSSWRTESSDSLFDFPIEIERVKLFLSTSPSMDDSFVEAEVVNLQTNPTFRQIKGSGLASLNPANSQVQVLLNQVDIGWSFDSHWLMDDVDDIHYLLMSSDEEGLEVGPGHLVRSTPFNEFENDLEIVDFDVITGDSKQLGDAFNPQWPFHLKPSQTLTISGKVRFEGIANAWAPQDSAQVEIEINAVPPKNESGGVDEWLGEPVVWSQKWFAALDQNSQFERQLIVPESQGQFPSGTRFEIRPSLSRSGPLDQDSSTSYDTTADSIFVPFIIDIEEPQIIELYALDSGGISAADGHVWMAGQSLALRLLIEDSDGLASPLKMYYWLENHDDSNGDGIMQANEYREVSVSLSNGSLSSEVDLPLLDDQQIKDSSQLTGRASIYFVAQDLAGNYIDNGGSFGQENDLATIIVANRQDTVINPQSLYFDTIEGLIMPGKEHHFAFDLTDGNGIQTLDKIELALLGRDDSSNCYITYFPRSSSLEYDHQCFVLEPNVMLTKHSLSATWTVNFSFRMDWNGLNQSGQGGGLPSLKVFDEGQDLGLGLSKISIFQWQPSFEVELIIVNLSDLTEPIGQTESSDIWLFSGDEIELNASLMHQGTEFSAEYFPTQSIDWHLSDGEREIAGVTWIEQDGSINLVLAMDPEIIKHLSATLVLSLNSSVISTSQTLAINITIDNSPPKIIIPAGYLTTIDSNDLQNVEIVAIIVDSAGVRTNEITMYWHYKRVGSIIEDSLGQAAIAFNSLSGTSTTFSSIVDMTLQNQSLIQSSDRIEIWFEATDKAGNELQGNGNSSSPIKPLFRWIDFEPRFDIIQATPYRPTIGEEINITARVVNEGVLGGNITLLLTDSKGIVYASEVFYLESGQWQQFTWSIEAWKTGRLGLVVQIVDYSGEVPVPIANVMEHQDKSQSSSSQLLGVSILMVVFASIGLFLAAQKRKQANEQYEMKRIESLVAKHIPAPPRPQDLDDNSQEE